MNKANEIYDESRFIKSIMNLIESDDEEITKSVAQKGFWDNFFGIAKQVATRPLTPQEIEETIRIYDSSVGAMKSARAFIIETRNKFQKHVAEMGSKLTELENNIITFQTRFADNKNYGKFYGRGFFELQEFSPIVKRFQKEMGTIYMRAEVIQEVLDFFNKKIERVDYFTQSVEEWKKNTLEKNRKLRRP